MENKITVIVVNDFDYIQGGASKVAIDTANILVNDENIDVYYFSGDSKSPSILNQKVKKICINTGESLKNKNKLFGIINGIYNIKAKKELTKLLKKLDRDRTIIHVHGWTKCLSSSIFDAIFKMKFEVVLTLHDYFTICPNGGLFNYKKNEICHIKGGSCKCNFANCDSRNYYFKIYRNIRFFVQNRIIKLTKKINNIIYISDFSWDILKDNFKKSVNCKKICNPIKFDSIHDNVDVLKNEYYLYVGRITKEKGVDIFCEAVTQANVKGVVVGDGNQKKILELKYPNIKFEGWKSEEEVKEFMKNAKALVMPSRWYEGAPLTNLEALSIGLPSIVSINCAASEVSNEQNNNGKTFNINNEQSLINILKTFEIKKVEKDILKFYTFDNYKRQLIIFFKLILYNKTNK